MTWSDELRWPSAVHVRELLREGDPLVAVQQRSTGADNSVALTHLDRYVADLEPAGFTLADSSSKQRERG